MKRKITILLSFMLAILAMLVLCACSPEDNGDDEGDEDVPGGTTINHILDYELSESGEYYIVTGYGLSIDEHVVIPAEYNGKPVKEIAGSSFNFYRANQRILSVTIPDTVTSIGKSAFEGCEKMATLNLGAGLEKIEESAFRGCKALTSVTLPDSLKILKKNAFAGCSNLESVVLSDGLTEMGKGVFNACGKLLGENGTNLNGVYYLSSKNGKSSWVIYSKLEIKEANLPDNAVGIADGVFNNRKSLATVEIPEGVRYIGTDAFKGCESLLTVNYGASESEWVDIFISTGNVELLTANITYK